MKASHATYASARKTVIAAHAELADAATGLDVALGPVDFEQDDPLEAQRAQVDAAEAALRKASSAVEGELQEAWDRNLALLQAAKQAHKDSTHAVASVQTEVAVEVNARLRNPLWPHDAPLVTEAEQALLDRADEDRAAAAEELRLAETKFKQGVTAEQLAG